MSTFENLQVHTLVSFYNSLIPRSESIPETLGKYELPDLYNTNLNIICRQSFIYKSNSEVFKKLKDDLTADENYCDTEIIHKSSDIGLPYVIKSIHKKSSLELCYDGILLRLTKSIKENINGLNELQTITELPDDPYQVIDSFEKKLKGLIKDFHSSSYSFKSFYTIDKVNWEDLGIKTSDEAMLKLECIDNSILTITAMIFAESGKPFSIYVNNTPTILEMLSNDFYIGYEIRKVNQLINEKLRILENIKQSVIECYKGLASNILHLKQKTESWHKIKNSINEIVSLKPLLNNLILYKNTLSKVIEERWSFFNGPKQLFFEEEPDLEEKIQHLRYGFIEADLIDSKIINISKKPAEPIYKNKFDELLAQSNKFAHESESLLNEERDLLTAFQTEFSAYAVWIAILALVISLIFGVLTLKETIIPKQNEIRYNKIDQIVYQLYGLTEEEIKIVEGKIG